ncbi:response regulator [Burkholderia pseudomallei]|nr:response regulator [Burkholderia pseudomallei]
MSDEWMLPIRDERRAASRFVVLVVLVGAGRSGLTSRSARGAAPRARRRHRRHRVGDAAAMGGSECHATFSRRVHACGRPNVRARRRPPKRAAATRRADEASEPTSQTGACRRYGTIRRPL